jgi:hypothetical protein
LGHGSTVGGHWTHKLKWMGSNPSTRTGKDKITRKAHFTKKYYSIGPK